MLFNINLIILCFKSCWRQGRIQGGGQGGAVCQDLKILENNIFWCKLYGFDENDMKIIKIEYLKVIKQSKNYNYQRSENWKFEVRSQELLGKQVWDLTNNLLKWIGLDILNGFFEL